MLPVECAFASPWRSAKYDQILVIYFQELRQLYAIVRSELRKVSLTHFDSLQTRLCSHLGRTSGDNLGATLSGNTPQECKMECQRSPQNPCSSKKCSPNGRSSTTHRSEHEKSFGIPGAASRPPASPTKIEASQSISPWVRLKSSSISFHIPVRGLR